MKINDVKNLSDADLCEALRCCGGTPPTGGCDICPCQEQIYSCADGIVLEAARRLDHMTALRAERDALIKQLRRMGVEYESLDKA